ncbi:hypothetical protein QQA43_31060 (plasmid) [Mycolicibacterium vanbaalenii]|uniref:hypothetical protein n=1 Tax=Mycolicibacterium vanbaalenii TaxID=110539 RepID=UPI0028779902|nr:hypothetical protein [Mycolicibacterium vanbaalenii]WND60089.1 hypothetical protein QQA43_31060 [Mycolicibacterium vanbaalenii]
MTAVVLDRPVVDEASVEEMAAPVTNTLTAAALFTAVSDALLFAAPTSAKQPVLEAVRLEFGAGQLVAVATDRFVLGASRVEYRGAAFTMMLAGSDAKALAKMAKTGKREESTREVVVEVAEADAAVTFRFSTGEVMTVRGLDVVFPKWRHLLPSDASRMGGIVGMGYTGAYLGRFTRARAEEQSSGAQMVVFPSVTSSGKPGPTAVRIGENFFGLLMPVRPPGDEWAFSRPSWLDVDTRDAAEVR